MTKRIGFWRKDRGLAGAPRDHKGRAKLLRSLHLEPLEQRRLLSVELGMVWFRMPEDKTLDLEVKYSVSGDVTPPPFEIGIFQSENGITPGQLLTTYHASGSDLTVGTHTVPIPANFEDAPLDYYLMAKLDAYDDIQDETDETNNTLRFEGGVFLGADRTTNVVRRQVFYNNSYWDGNDAAANANDHNAIAPDKFPLLPGQKATFRNVTSYDKGINGIIVDLWDPRRADPRHQGLGVSHLRPLRNATGTSGNTGGGIVQCAA